MFGGKEAAMSIDVHKRSGQLARRTDLVEAMQYRIIYAICFVVFLVGAVLERAAPWAWLARRSNSERRPSILEQAGEAAGTCTTYAFMS
jgi:hypothetical protein